LTSYCFQVCAPVSALLFYSPAGVNGKYRVNGVIYMIILLIIATLLFLYLGYALIHPEKF
jgi:K+-transporting ATPase KdpF subunit